MRVQRPQIGIIGNGFVGGAITAGFSLHANIRIFDKKIEKSTHTFDDVVNGSDVIFISVPTPMRKIHGGSIDIDILDGVFREVDKVNERKDNICVVKSTVVPGTVEKYIKEYPDLNIIFSPEFLTERAARLDFINSSRIILGGDLELTKTIEKIYRYRFPYATIIHMDVTSAQFVKYMANCFFATKVTFMNEMNQLAKKLNLDWSQIVHGFITDGRIGNSHLDVPGHDGNYGFGGKCFPKDLNAFIEVFLENEIEPTVLQSVWKKNLEVRNELDWAQIEGAVSDVRENIK